MAKTKKFGFGGLANALNSATNKFVASRPATTMAKPAGAMPGGAPMPGGIQGAMNAIKANAAKNPGMAAPAGAPMGGRAAMITPPRMMRMNKGGSVGSASKRADGCAVRGKTKA